VEILVVSTFWRVLVGTHVWHLPILSGKLILDEVRTQILESTLLMFLCPFGNTGTVTTCYTDAYRHGNEMALGFLDSMEALACRQSQSPVSNTLYEERNILARNEFQAYWRHGHILTSIVSDTPGPPRIFFHLANMVSVHIQAAREAF
jgi:hypothetical protein